jgi:hypothetical protein
VLEQVDEVLISTGEGVEPCGPAGDTYSEAQRAGRPPIVLLNDIRDLAFRKWQEAGCPSTDSAHFWVEAERDLQQGK